jgi:RNA 3''-phosphate cyclase
MLEIDSSKNEGGGQMVRTSVALAAVTDQELKLTRIRESRPTNGLSKQHCTAVNAVAEMTGSSVDGNYTGSRELVFKPGNIQNNDVIVDIGAAGSISLMLQAMLLAARNYNDKVRMDISGGTNVKWAPPIDSYQQILFPLMEKMGIHAKLDILERGFYPVGGGRIIAELEPMRNISPLMIKDLGELKGIEGVCYIQNLPDWIHEHMIDSCKEVIGDRCAVNITVQRTAGHSKGAGMSLVADYENGRLGSNVLTSKGHPAKRAGEDVAKDLINEMDTGSTMDVHTADQLLAYMAMADGKSEFTVSKISKHLLSQMDTLESFLDVRFGVERKSNVYHITVTPGASK